MATAAFEAWLDRTAPIEIAKPIYEATVTTINFTIIDADRDAVDLTGYALKFAAKLIEDDSELFDVACTITDAENGLASAALSVDNLASPGEVIAALNLFAGGNAAGDVTDRVYFRFDVVGAIG